MANKPDITDSQWALNDVIDLVTGVNNKVEPLTIKKTDGWDRREKPPREYDNYMKNQYYQWLLFLEQFVEYYSGQTTTAAETELFLNGVSNNRLSINTNEIITFEAIVNAVKSDYSQSKSWKIKNDIIKSSGFPYILTQEKEILNTNNWDITSIGATSGNSGALTEEATPNCIFFKPDGTQMYLIGSAQDTVYQYPLSTAWDITSIGATSGNSGTLTEENTPSSIFFKPDGTQMYLIGFNTDTVYQYPLSTPWDITSIGSTSGNSGALTEESIPTSIFFKPDGTQMYLIGTNTDTVYQYPLSTAWDITSIGATSGNSGALTEEATPNCIFFKYDGIEMYSIGSTNDTVYQYPLQLAWDVNFEADITNNALVPKVIGEAAKTINWKIKLETLTN